MTKTPTPSPATAPGRTDRRRDLAALSVLAVVVALPLIGLFRNQGPPMEEGFMLVFPERVLRGDLPNRDFLHLYGPGSLWALAGAFKVLGTNLFVERAFGLLQQLGIVLAVFGLARPWGRVAALACAAASAVIIMPPIGLTALAWVGGVAFAALALLAALEATRTADTQRAGRLALLAGVLAGLALLWRLDLVLAVGLAGLVVGRGATRPLRTRMLAGVLAGVAPYVVHLATAGPGTVFRGMVLDPVVYLRGGRRLSIPPPPDELEGFLQKAGELRKIDWPLPALSSPAQLTVWFFVLLAAVAALLLTGRAVRRADGSHRGLVLLAAGALGLGMLPQALQRTDSTHFAWVSCVPLALLPLPIIEWSRRWFPAARPRSRSLAAGGLVLALLVLVVPRWTVQQYTDYVAQSFGIHRQAQRIERNGRVFFYGRPDVAEALRPLIADLDARSRPGDSLLVGTSDLRKTPYSDAFLYYLFPELEPATYYIEMDPGVANAEDSGLDEEVAGADFLVLSAVWDDWDEPNDSRVLGPDAPNAVVRDRFCLVGEYEGLYRLLERCERRAER